MSITYFFVSHNLFLPPPPECTQNHSETKCPLVSIGGLSRYTTSMSNTSTCKIGISNHVCNLQDFYCIENVPQFHFSSQCNSKVIWRNESEADFIYKKCSLMVNLQKCQFCMSNIYHICFEYLSLPASRLPKFMPKL